MSQKLYGDYNDRDRARRVHKEKGTIRACPECQAVSTAKRWYYDPALVLVSGRVEVMLCPGCAAVRDQQVGGYVELHGPWPDEQRRELLALVDRVATYSQRRNPANRLIDVRVDGDAVLIETTTNWVAEHIARNVRKAFPGELTMQWPKGDEVVRIRYRARVPAVEKAAAGPS